MQIIHFEANRIYLYHAKSPSLTQIRPTMSNPTTSSRVPVSVPTTLSSFTSTWQPHLVASINDHHVKVAKISGSFIWHAHPNSDELFYVLAGEVRMELEGQEAVDLKEGDVFVVPRGVRHRPSSGEGGATIMMVEHESTVNTGDTEDEAGRERRAEVRDVRG
ncbi:RmlC-like cupin domain-containing protein [Phaeosphaeria sp. MPI-PUGE-AT-0046c]|nr:RmlC-like cupin domain-containing protein [Phaeosphaeria sp. MPI-PUGE-AT-0046c]